MALTGSELINKVINRHKAEGKDLAELGGQKFVYGNAIYTLGKPSKRGAFNLKIEYVKDLEEEFLAGRI